MPLRDMHLHKRGVMKMELVGSRLFVKPIRETSRNVKCPKCKTVVTFANLSVHFNSCVGEFFACCESNLVGLPRDAVKHHILNCMRVRYPCKRGCGKDFAMARQGDSHHLKCLSANTATSIKTSEPLNNDGLLASAIDDRFRIYLI